MIKDIKVQDTVIFQSRWCEEDIYDGEVLSVDEKGVTVVYLYDGYKSGTDDVLLEDILAKVDLKAPRIKLKNTPYSGNFIVY